MSNVLVRNRSKSEFQYIYNAVQIREYITSIIMNEKYFPKRYRFIFTVPIEELCRKMVQAANSYRLCGESLDTVDEDTYKILYTRRINALKDILESCENILAEFHVARKQFYIKSNVYEKVVGQIVDEQELIEELYDFEKERYAKFLKKHKNN